MSDAEIVGVLRLTRVPDGPTDHLGALHPSGSQACNPARNQYCAGVEGGWMTQVAPDVAEKRKKGGQAPSVLAATAPRDDALVVTQFS
jgi:hypothetical protein